LTARIWNRFNLNWNNESSEKRDRPWMIPFVATLLLVAVLLLVGQATGIAPFIYTPVLSETSRAECQQ
jgi:hypothetical protein